MFRPHRLILSDEARQELVDWRNNHKKAYVRERCAAILKVADGARVDEVAYHGLLRQRKPATVYAWIRRYRHEGIRGLIIRPGRGRKPAFSPPVPERR